MNIVRTREGELIHASQVEESKTYFCPECGEEVMRKVSRNGVVFFAHIPSNHHQEETLAHQEGKRLLLESLKKWEYSVELEPYIASIEQIPDLFITENNKQWCIEYQCSVIPTENIVRRTIRLEEEGIRVAWILGEKYEIQNKLSDTFCYLMRYHPQLGNYLLFFVNGEIIFHTRIRLKSRSQQMSFQTIRVKLEQFSWKKWQKIMEESISVRAHLKPDLSVEWTPRDTMLFKKLASPLTRAFLIQLYRCRQTIDDLPSTFRTFPMYNEIFKVPNLVWKGHAWMLLQKMDDNGEIDFLSFVKKVGEVWRPLMRPVSNPERQMESSLWELMEELISTKNIRMNVHPKKMNRLQKDCSFGKIVLQIEGRENRNNNYVSYTTISNSF